ncbi:LuxR C-terminal-related transcriptional regulator [Leucobacter sp. NPDC015123]|uniref:helix-turn-helix transcriptional regulator n=1 Tax=Leucobacter sp. NPDC015123 TaxID=3364129 RepID=UPI0036F44F38
MHQVNPQGGGSQAPATLPPLPSRIDAETGAFAALRAGSAIAVLSDEGFGRSTLLWRFAADSRKFGVESLTVLGSEALTPIPFSHLAPLATRVPEIAGYAADPLRTSQALANRFPGRPLRVFVDDSEYVDPTSAAILTQLAGVGTVQLVIAVRDEASLPSTFRAFLAHAGTAKFTLHGINEGDAKVMLEAQLGQLVNASSLTHLLVAVAGVPRELSRLADAAMRAGSFVSARGYLVYVREHVAEDSSEAQQRVIDWWERAATGVPEGDQTQLLALLAPLIASGDPEARLFAGRLEAITGDYGHGMRLLTPQAGDTEYFRASAALWRAHAGEQIDPGQFEEWAANEDFSPSLRFGLLAAVIAHECYAGTPVAALERGFAALESDLWKQVSGPDSGALLYSLHLALVCEGAHELVHAFRVVGIDWDRLGLDHGLFIASRAHALIECGRAVEALDLAHQVLALTEIGDPFGIAGFVAAIGAASATMLEDVAGAGEMLAMYRAGSARSGQMLRPEAERLALGAILLVDGVAAARVELDTLLGRASKECQPFVTMRLTHEAWRLGLLDGFEALAVAAEDIEGQLADALRRLPDGALIEDIASSQYADGRTLYAAEFLSEASRVERANGNKMRAQALLTQAAELADQLPGVNTPRLARVRVDPTLLTAREIDVCVRAAAGLTNVLIAEELFLSQRTVEGHLQRAYAKLGVSDRRQLLPLVDEMPLRD